MTHHSTAQSIWSDERRIELLKKLWAEGLSCSRIAEEIGAGCTRNSVIGMVHRLGLSGRVRPDRPIKVPRDPRVRILNRGNAGFVVERQPKIEVEPFIPLEEIEIPEAQRKTLLQLTDETCRWPVGDPQDYDFFFCGGVVGPGSCKPYCKDHARIAYAAPHARGWERPDKRFHLRKKLPSAMAIGAVTNEEDAEAVAA